MRVAAHRRGAWAALAVAVYLCALWVLGGLEPVLHVPVVILSAGTVVYLLASSKRPAAAVRRTTKWLGLGICAAVVVWWFVVKEDIRLGNLRLQPRPATVFPDPWTCAAGHAHWGIPAWIAVMLAGVPTAVLWQFDRRKTIPPGHCRSCHYNLTGNVSGRCPECGEKV